MRAQVVIGANYGDEGKGRAVDVLAAQKDKPLVVRFNGGAQAGHTVQTADGKRHVFSHFGAGTFAGAPTFLTRHFVTNPELFFLERQELVNPTQVFVSPASLVTTPFDVMLNRWQEEDRGSARHGSCGIGFGETIERSTRGYPLFVRDLARPEYMRRALAILRRDYFAERVAQLGLNWTKERAASAGDDLLVENWLVTCARFLDCVTLAPSLEVLRGYDLIFEGAQGLLLDQDEGCFPHVTRSNTGLKNVVEVAESLGITSLEVLYMTRPYATRHGAGPLPAECKALEWVSVDDPTNKANPWQGELRVAPLNLDTLRMSITKDLVFGRGTPMALKPAIGLTCLDQLSGVPCMVWGGKVQTFSSAIGAITMATGFPLAVASYGPARGDHDGALLKDLS